MFPDTVTDAPGNTILCACTEMSAAHVSPSAGECVDAVDGGTGAAVPSVPEPAARGINGVAPFVP